MIEKLESEIIEFMLNSMPVEISFVDENDEVRYFNKNGDRIFPRPRSVIGKKVHQCHPKISVDKVIEIIESFKNGKRDVANFWIKLKGILIYIRYFAVRDNNEKYLGTLEVSQDITDIKKIEGEKRLLDWK
jgi:PAS domain S-box-containing protein